MLNRRKFLISGIWGTGTLLAGNLFPVGFGDFVTADKDSNKIPVVISTWKHGLQANETAWHTLQNGANALDAVEKGVMVVEADIKNTTVGIGGTPDREGVVTLDASIMDWQGNAGAVCFVQNIKHPITLARRVMEKTPHVMLAGDGALRFALKEGFTEEVLLTTEARNKWMQWKRNSFYKPTINIENHDTIGMLAIDQSGKIAGACTTSGLAYKMHGRVGDSPIIGAGLYIDNDIGGAVATGLGEAVMKSVSSFLIVELMRQGKSPQVACQEAIRRIVKKNKRKEKFQVGFIALNKKGEYGSFSIRKGFDFALYQNNKNRLLKSKHYL